MLKRLLFVLLVMALTWPLLFFIGCRQRDGLVDVGSVLVDPVLFPIGFRPDPRPELLP